MNELCPPSLVSTHSVVATDGVRLEGYETLLSTGPSLTPPFDDPVLIFGLAMVIFLVAPLVLERYRLPGIIGIILIGAAIGPNGAHLLERDATIELLGEVGLIYLMFIAGLEINLTQFLEYKDRSIVFGLLSFVIPQAVGTVVGVSLLGLELPAALLFAAIFSSHTLLAYPVVNRLGIANDEAMTATIGGTILTDTLALLVLAIVIAGVDGTLDAAFWTQLSVGLTLFFIGVWVLVPRLGRWFFRIHSEESYFEFLFVMAVLFICAFLAELVGVEHIIGAFLAGLTLNRLIPESGTLMNRIEFVGNALFIPFFLLSVGMLVNVGVVLEGVDTLALAGSLLVMVFVTKYVAAWAAGRVYGYDRDQVLGMFGLSVGQAAAALAIVQIGFDAGVPGFGQDMINAVVVMILVVSLFSPALVERAGVALVRARDHEAYDPGETSQRILVPISRETEYAESLLDLAVTIRNERAHEPIHTVTVVRPEQRSRTTANVADVETRLEDLEAYTAGAEVPIEPHTRVNHNIASGIVRSSVENRITTLVVGWDGQKARTQQVFGHIIDQVLDRTTELTLVGRLREPLNTTQRIVLVLPPDIHHNDGFSESVHTVKRISAQTGAPIHGLVVDGNPSHFDRVTTRLEPPTSATFHAVDGWNELFEELRDETRSDDFLVCVSARRNEVGWHSELRTLPNRLARVTDANFVVMYPATEERADDRQFLRFP
ncbi:Kef-type K+ transport system, membrane component KefB [Natronorubrum sediminis]|uniref:Kef-type K+ transport system, membrane component KefB n=1 Tax=Natronorubrum sediminis TaxID=640943 RepID=A0A1H6G3B6_9EURY|nr:Kef-type K+ transport system, membrane component KefB [Natronorubrum sediminis]